MKQSPKYRAMDRFNDPSSIEYKTRLDNKLMHCLAPNIDFNSKGNRCIRLRCVMCCYKCSNGVTKKHIRLSRVTSKFSPICKVVLCQHCFVTFHTTTQLSVPECVCTKESTKKGKRTCKPACSPTTTDEKAISLPSPFVRKWKLIDVNTELTPQIRRASTRVSKKHKKCDVTNDKISDVIHDTKKTSHHVMIVTVILRIKNWVP